MRLIQTMILPSFLSFLTVIPTSLLRNVFALVNDPCVSGLGSVESDFGGATQCQDQSKGNILFVNFGLSVG